MGGGVEEPQCVSGSTSKLRGSCPLHYCRTRTESSQDHWHYTTSNVTKTERLVLVVPEGGAEVCLGDVLRRNAHLMYADRRSMKLKTVAPARLSMRSSMRGSGCLIFTVCLFRAR